MSEQIKDGTGKGYTVKVGDDNRIWTHSVTEEVGSERSVGGHLFGIGTGSLTLTGSETVAPMLWMRNDDPDHLFQVDKIIYGWNGGSTTWAKTCFCLISYQKTVPTGAETAIDANIENISLSGAVAPVTDALLTGYKWDGVGSSGMTGSTGGYGQISNRIAKGDTSLIGISGQIVLGQNDTLEVSVTPEEAGLFQVAVVYWKVPVSGRA